MRTGNLLAALAAVSFLVSAPACARMYQWMSPSTGSVQLSGEPPAWYRAAGGGPRVRVFENGNMVDDTGIRLPDAQREELRQAAFRESEQRERTEALKRLERAALRQKRRQEAEKRIAQAERDADRRSAERAQQASASTAAASGAPADAAGSATDDTLDDAAVRRLKAIISEFDRGTP